MAFDNRRELLFVYSVKDANPNGDPLNANHPRYDDESGQILVSDVRVKRTVRDQWVREGRDVFVDGEPKTITTRMKELKEKLKVKTGKEALSGCIDTRLFGVTYADTGSKQDKETFAWTGPVQFKWGRSLHQSDVVTVQGTAAFAREDESKQRSFRSEYLVPFVLIADYAIANQHASKTTGATDDDLEALFDSVWTGTANLITRSKVGHMPRFLMEVRYVSGFDGIIGAMDEKIVLRKKNGDPLSPDEQRALRSCDGVCLDVSGLSGAMERVLTDVESVRIRRDAALELDGFEKLQGGLGGKLKLETR